MGQSVTSGDGAFRFDGLLAGAYSVEQLNLAGMYSTTPDFVEVLVLPGQRSQVRFGDWEGRKTWMPSLLQ